MKFISLSISILSFGFLFITSSSAVNDSVQDEENMVLIPGREFDMGTRPGQNQKYVDNTQHRVKVDSFYIDKYEVTNRQYLEFCNSTGHNLPEFWGMDVFCSGPDFPDHPVVGVNWVDFNVGFRCAKNVR